MPRRTSTVIPGPPAGGRRSYIDQVIEHRPDGQPVTVADRIIAAVRAGNYLETAAALAGVRVATIRDWLYQGNATLRALANGAEQHELPHHHIRYAEFADAVARAEAEAEAEDVARLQLLARGQATTTKEVTVERRNADGELVERTTRSETETLAPDSAALRWRLERRHPRRWQGSQRVELTGEEGGPIELTVAEKRDAVLDTLSRLASEREADAGEFTDGVAAPAIAEAV